MPKYLSPVENEKNVLLHEKHQTYYTNYYDAQTGDTLRVTTKIRANEKGALSRAKKIAQDKYRAWVTTPEKSKSEVLFDDIAVEILAAKKASPRKKTYLAARNQLRHLMKTFRGRRICTMDKTSFDEHVERARELTPGRNLNDDRKYFIMVMLRAYSQGLVPKPVTKLAKPDPEGEVGRELSNEELKRLLDNIGKLKAPKKKQTEAMIAKRQREADDFALQFDTALTKGLRLRETLGLRYSYFDWERRTIKLPPEVTKTKKGREIPLDDGLLKRFRERFLVASSPWVFPSPGNPFKPVYDNKTAWKNLCQRAAVNARWHDLRHTCATRMLRAGVPEAYVSKILGMSRKVLQRIYDHINIDDLRPAAETVDVARIRGFK